MPQSSRQRTRAVSNHLLSKSSRKRVTSINNLGRGLARSFAKKKEPKKRQSGAASWALESLLMLVNPIFLFELRIFF